MRRKENLKPTVVHVDPGTREY